MLKHSAGRVGWRYDSPNECLGYGTKQSDGEAPVMLEIWGMRTTLCCHLWRRESRYGGAFLTDNIQLYTAQ